jgi:hypothetical protein
MATKTENAIPRIPLNLRQHKRGIAVTWAVLFMSSCAMPILLYFILKYVASLKANAGTSQLLLISPLLAFSSCLQSRRSHLHEQS